MQSGTVNRIMNVKKTSATHHKLKQGLNVSMADVDITPSPTGILD